jgi:hypothetical protein
MYDQLKWVLAILPISLIVGALFVLIGITLLEYPVWIPITLFAVWTTWGIKHLTEKS